MRCFNSRKSKASHEFIKTPSRPFIQIEVTIEPGKPQTEQLIAAIEKHDITDAVLKIIYHVPENQKDSVDLKAVQHACASAMHIVGIIPIRKVVARERRIGAAKVTMELPELLNIYFDNKPEFNNKKEALIEKTLLLLDECRNEQENSE